MRCLLLSAALSILFLSCQTEQTPVDEVAQYILSPDSVITRSLAGTPLTPVPESPASLALKDSLLRIAYDNYKSDPANLENIIWFGRRLAYLSNYPEAMRVYTKGLHYHPQSPELYRHRGHRYITMRKFDLAQRDLAKAAEMIRGEPLQIEPDGLPNAQNIPLSSTQFNIWYHLALAHYLQGNYEQAAVAYDSCLHWSVNDDLVTATTDWYYMTAIRMGDTARARELLEPIHTEMNIIENATYYRRLQMYQGLIQPEELLDFENITPENQLNVVTQGYGVANYLLQNGREEEGREIMQKIVGTSYWPAFGYIAAEADLYR